MQDIASYKSCEALSCAMKMKGDRHGVNYHIYEMCRFKGKGECPYEAKFLKEQSEQHK